MSKNLLVFCALVCIVCLTQFHKSCVQSMSVNEITSGGLLADMQNEEPPHHLRHQAQHHRHHHHHHHQQQQSHSPNITSETPTLTPSNIRPSPNMWTILGQTVKIHDGSAEQNDNENDAKYYKEFEQQHLEDKFKREHGAHDVDQAIDDPTKSLSCAKCKSRPEIRMTEEELTNLRIEYVKNQILKKLRLTKRPQVSASNIPKPVAEGATIHQENAQEQIKRAPDEFYGKTTQKIVFPELGEFGFGLRLIYLLRPDNIRSFCFFFG